MAEILGKQLEELADEIRSQRPHRGKLHMEQSADESKVPMGRPPRLSHADEFELYCYRKSGLSIKTCASMWRVSVPTANRIIAKFRQYEALIGPSAQQFRDMIDRVRDSTLS